MILEPPEVALDNDHAFWYYFEEPDTDVGGMKPADGLLNVQGFFSLTGDQAAAAIGSTTTTLNKITPPGEYLGILAGATVTSALGAYVNQFLYEIVKSGTTVRSARRVKIVATRSPLE